MSNQDKSVFCYDKCFGENKPSEKKSLVSKMSTDVFATPDQGVSTPIVEENKFLKYECEVCQFFTKRTNDWNKHLKTKKHQKNVTGEQLYTCIYCEKQYKVYKSFWCHAKKCKEKNSDMKNELIDSSRELKTNLNSDLIYKLLNENQEMRNFLVEQNQEMMKLMSEQNNKIISLVKPNVTNNILNGDINNNKFNINVFLNEKCKNAMNLSEFLDTIVVSREDLENNARLGFVNGMTKIFIDNLKRLNISERSIHCTDFKRETIYVKEDDKWIKDENNEKLNSAISSISSKSMRTLVAWKHENPDHNDYDSDFFKLSNIILQNSVSGQQKTTFFPKIIRNIARETTINKNSIDC